MKKILSVLLILSLLLCSMNVSIAEETTRAFASLSDPSLLQCVEDTIYAGLVDQFDSEDYIIENVRAIYISQEYLEELAFNSKSNIFFGYTLEELDAQFQGKRYVFTLSDNNETVIEEFTAYDNTYERVIKNVAVGTGVILVCATVTVVTAGAGLTTVSGFFAISTMGATVESLVGAGFGGIFAGTIEGIRTGDFDSALKAGTLAASEGFKWGAISGTVTSHIPTQQIMSGGVTIADDALNVSDDVLRMSDDVLNLSDDVLNVSDDVLNISDDVLKVSDDVLRISDDAANAIDDILKNADYNPPGSVNIADNLAEYQKAELRALNDQGGYSQLVFKDGKLTTYGELGSTRPDVVRKIGDHLEAVEVKYYDLSNNSCLNMMYKEIRREIENRITHLPSGSTQRIVLDVTKRGFTTDIVDPVKEHIIKLLDDIYPNIPIDVVGLIL